MEGKYQKVYEESILDPEGFWAEASNDVHWYKVWDKVLDESNAPFYKWFNGGQTNTCFNALDIHIKEGRGDQHALIYDSPVTGVIKKLTFNDLLNEVSKLADVLSGLGIKKGDTSCYLHADDSGSCYIHARLRKNWGSAFGGIRRFCLS